MAEEKNNPGAVTNSFSKGMVKDYNETFVGEGIWTHARNAVNNSHDGQVGVLGNEPANLHCVHIPYTLIGAVALTDDQWVLFSTDDVNSEIGIFDESRCSYQKIINDTCLNFKRTNLITGVFRKKYNCDRLVYWDDGLNPSRVLNIDDVPFICFSDEEPGVYHYKVFAASCAAGTASSTVTYISITGQAETRVLANGEEFSFATYKPTAINIVDKSCKAEPCYLTNVIITVPPAEKISLQRCLTQKEAFELQFPNGYLNPLTQVYPATGPGGEYVLCDCIDPGVAQLTTPSRLVKIDQSSGSSSICKTPKCTERLDCEKIRLNRLVTTPCIDLKKSKTSGTLPNGSYQVAVAYSINGVRVSDYFTPSEVQSIFDHNNVSGALDVNISNLDKDYDEYELVVIWFANSINTVKRIGFYSTSQTKVHINTIDPQLVNIPFSLIPLQSPVYEKSDAMYEINNYLMRVGMYGKFDFNYQLQANKIQVKWVAVQYPADYYIKGGNNAGYMRDEQYAFFIRWIYNTGEKSATYHIPGRSLQAGEEGIWRTKNTATVTSLSQIPQVDGGLQIAEGEMAYWESTERYPDNKPEIWGDLCGKAIRHHKFPDQTTHPNTVHYTVGGSEIITLGVKFDNVTHPLDNAGNPIQSIVGYEILRGSREGQKSIVAKGLFNNMREFNVPNRLNVKGLYQNYPFNDLRADYYLTSDAGIINKGAYKDRKGSPLTGYSKTIFSFHSPETTFSKPFLSVSEVKIYQEATGKSSGYFEVPYKHPRAKVIGEGAEIIEKVLGLAALVTSMDAVLGGEPSPLLVNGTKDIPFSLTIVAKKPEKKETTLGNIIGAIGNVFGIDGLDDIVDTIVYGFRTLSYASKLAFVVYVTSEVTLAQVHTLVYGLLPRKQYALQYNAHGYYNNFSELEYTAGIKTSYYLDNNVQNFGTSHVINNLFRNSGVILETDIPLPDLKVEDNSRNTFTQMVEAGKGNGINQSFSTDISSYYGALKTPLDSQYGQLQSIVQMPTFSCVQQTNPDKSAKFTSDIIFGGDTYINRFTEKNPFFFFNDWMVDLEDEFEWDYRSFVNVTYPRYWMDTTKQPYRLLTSSSDFHHLNGGKKLKDKTVFYQDPGYFYLFCNGIRDFFVESEINLAQRDWGEDVGQRHYDHATYTDLSNMFRSDVIKSSNYYKYDYSLSASKLYNNFIPWGQLLPVDYSPKKAETCFSYYPNRVTYSLPQTEENKKDNWRVFLANNYRDFSGPVTSIKAIGKTGALFMMAYESPMQFVGVDTLQTDAGTKLYIGDGGLLNPSTPVQSVVNADKSYQYGSCQNKFGVASTPAGVFWVSRDQGKIFYYGGGLKDVARNGMKWWFSRHLPSKLLEAFPDYPLKDNPVYGVGVQLTYDNTNEVLYILNKDYKPRYSDLILDGSRFFRVIDGVKTYYDLNSSAFEDASWTISYDIKSESFISFHDWKPTIALPGKKHFMTVDTDSIWKHNERCDQYCNFYHKDYPFEVEFVSSTGQTVSTVRNVEFILETYKYYNNCMDKFHLLDESFDQAMVYNSEQVSGLLELKLKSKINPVELLTYPQIGNTSIKINYSKEENKYRFNQFWDITKNRGEFGGTVVPMFITKANGYEYSINPDYVNYNKAALEHKRFRHMVNRVWVRKNVSGDLKMLFKISNQKIIQSPR